MSSNAAQAGAANAPPQNVLELRGLSKTFGRIRVLSEVDFTVAPGEIHCLLGHNGSGKSTLIKIVGGYHDPDPGCQMIVNGRPTDLPMTARQIRDLGIRFVHQSLGLVPSLTVAEHFAQDQLDGRSGWFISPAGAVAASRKALSDYRVDVDPHSRIEELSAVDRALVAIVRAVTSLSRRRDGLAGCLLVLDEPTSFLPREEVERLFDTTRDIARHGAGVILVTHDTDEVLSIADRVTVLRDGKVAGVVPRGELDRQKLVRLIVGHDLAPSRAAAPSSQFEDHADVEIARAGPARDVAFRVGRGEIVGLTGLIGSGYADVVHALFGSRQGSGRLRLGGTALDLESLTPRRAIAHGVAFVPSDRAGSGAALDLTVAENTALMSLAQFVNPLFVSAAALERAVLPHLIEASVRPPIPSLEMGRLSGGNQQKVVLAKWLAARPALLLLDEPTQGIDVGAREQIFAMLRQLAAGGAGIICASTDHDQLAQLCDRVLVLNRGRLVAELQRHQLTPTGIGEAVLAAPEADATEHHS